MVDPSGVPKMTGEFSGASPGELFVQPPRGHVWNSSAGTSGRGSAAPAAGARVLQLHRLHFVERKGTDAVNELVAQRCAEGKRQDAMTMKEHRVRIQDLKERCDQRMRDMKEGGSFSLRSAVETVKMEDLRQDPEEAKAKAVAHMRHLARSFREESGAMTARVRGQPAMNVRSREEWAEIEDKRTDPAEAKAKMTEYMHELAHTYSDKKAAIAEKVKSRSPFSTWSSKDRAMIEELRQDPDEAKEKMTKHMKHLSEAWVEEQATMKERVKARPPINIRPRAEWDQIEELREDPREARERMAGHMRLVAQKDREEKAVLKAKVAATPRKTFWTKKEWDQIEELRQDPDEAKEKATKHMMELAETYNQERKRMKEKVAALPSMTFQSAEEIRRRNAVQALRTTQMQKLARR